MVYNLVAAGRYDLCANGVNVLPYLPPLVAPPRKSCPGCVQRMAGVLLLYLMLPWQLLRLVLPWLLR